MGLCKCPYKKVTNLFCFQHRVNVCEHCLVANHSRCIVQSYLRWLRDSDFSPVCTLCNVALDDEDAGECVRLMCFDVFHWQCLDRLYGGQPPMVDLGQYACPSCRGQAFPSDNVVSPLAGALRATLSTARWARTGLGMPELSSFEDLNGANDPTQDSSFDQSSIYDEDHAPHHNSASDYHQDNYYTNNALTAGHVTDHVTDHVTPHPHHHHHDHSSFSYPNRDFDPTTNKHSGDDHVVTMSANEVEAHMHGDPPPHYHSNEDTPTRSQMNGLHKVHGSSVHTNHGYDGYGEQRSSVGMRNIDSHFRVTSGAPRPTEPETDDKYKRRNTAPITSKINSWPKLRRFLVTLSAYKLFIVIIVICLGGFILVDSFIKYGRSMADREPFLDPMANPNIRVNSH